MLGICRKTNFRIWYMFTLLQLLLPLFYILITCILLPFQFISERAQVEQEYALRIESLGYKYSNSITQQAVNPLVPHVTHSPTAATGTTGMWSFFKWLCLSYVLFDSVVGANGWVALVLALVLVLVLALGHILALVFVLTDVFNFFPSSLRQDPYFFPCPASISHPACHWAEPEQVHCLLVVFLAFLGEFNFWVVYFRACIKTWTLLLWVHCYLMSCHFSFCFHFSAAASAQTPSALRSVGGMLGYAGVSSLNVLSSAAKTVPAAGAAVLGEFNFCDLIVFLFAESGGLMCRFFFTLCTGSHWSTIFSCTKACIL